MNWLTVTAKVSSDQPNDELHKAVLRHPADHASNIANWLSVLKNNKRAIFTAAAHAQRVANYLHGPQAPPRDGGRLFNPLARPRTDVNAGRLRGWLTAG